MTEATDDSKAKVSRRRLLLGGAAAGAGAVALIGIDKAGQYIGDAITNHDLETQTAIGRATVPFYGLHQAGVETEPQSYATFLGFRLLPETNKAALKRWLRVISDDAARLTQGIPALADSEPELAVNPARLTITFGFGPNLVSRALGNRPSWLEQMPVFKKDQLLAEFTGADLLVQLAADDTMTVNHATRMLKKDSRSFAEFSWQQDGFRNAAGSTKPGQTPRNLMGQLDGTVNPTPSSDDFNSVVWRTDPGWLAGSTTLVLRRIRMLLNTWDKVDRIGREQTIGRNLTNGAPLTGKHEHDDPDFQATDSLGFPKISTEAHIRRARSDNPAERIFRRVYNYEDSSPKLEDAGLLFASFQADPIKQFLPIQQRIDEFDALNEWVTAVGSAVVWIPPGCQPGGYIGEGILE